MSRCGEVLATGAEDLAVADASRERNDRQSLALPEQPVQLICGL